MEAAWSGPIFAFPTGGDPILWEHLGMLTRDDYSRSWKRKLTWYQQNGFVQGTNLFATQDDPNGGLDSQEVRHVARR